MILKEFIEKQYNNRKIKITDFDSNSLTTNSYDVCLGNTLICYPKGYVLDPKKESPFETFCINEKGFMINPGEFYLASTKEKIGSDFYVPILHAKSGTARQGLFVHVTADLIDIGSFGNITLQLYATLPIKVYAGMKIAQVTFWKPLGDIELYKGKYQHSEGPRVSQIYQDFI